MIAAVDQWFVNQLKRIKLGNNSITVYAYNWNRAKGKTVPPCFAITKHIPFRFNLAADSPGHSYVLPSDETVHIEADEWGPERDVPVNYIERPWPSQITLYYQIDAMATDNDQITAMLELLPTVIPDRIQPKISGQYVTVCTSGDPATLDHLEDGLFRSVFRYRVEDVQLVKPISTIIPAIREIKLEQGVQ